MTEQPAILPSKDDDDALIAVFSANHGPIAVIKRGGNVTTAQLSGLKDLLAEMVGLELRHGLAVQGQKKPSGIVTPRDIQ